MSNSLPPGSTNSSPAADPSGDLRPLFVDLDGTLIQTDLLHEAILALLWRSPGKMLGLLPELRRGRAAFKRAVSRHITPDLAALPYRTDVLDFVRSRRDQGGKIILATASDAEWAVRISEELGLFDHILASDGVRNCKGPEKLAQIREHCRQEGATRFDYIGDSLSDLPVWREAEGVYLAGPSPAMLRRVAREVTPTAILGTHQAPWAALARALRPHQWVKNLLVFVPLVASQGWGEPRLIFAAFVCLLCFCLCASAVYLLNDLVDLQSDRRHPVKQHRPLASGALPVWSGPVVAAGLLGIVVALSTLFLPLLTTVWLVLYFVGNSLYSLVIKRVAMLDVLTLAALYTSRLFAGASAVEVEVSEWLAAFSIFLFTSLAFAKRYAELDRLLRSQQEVARGRGYRAADISLVESAGLANGYIAVLVLALYLNSPAAKSLYRQTWSLWLVCIVLMYWIGRIWLKAKRGELTEDPLVFALRDRASLWLGLVLVVLVGAAIVGIPK